MIDLGDWASERYSVPGEEPRLGESGEDDTEDDGAG